MTESRTIAAAAWLTGVVLLSSCGQTTATPPADAPLPPAAASPTDFPCGTPDKQDQLGAYVGLSLVQAEALARKQDRTLRVIGRDGECFPVTMDYSPTRVNVYLDDELVRFASLG